MSISQAIRMTVVIHDASWQHARPDRAALATVAPIKIVERVAQELPPVFGWLDMLTTHDLPASGAQTRQMLSWGATTAGGLIVGGKHAEQFHLSHQAPGNSGTHGFNVS
jgi:hypothetical protein